MKKFLISLLLLNVSVIATAADELTFGFSLGYENIDYGLTMTGSDSGVSSADITSEGTVVAGDMSYTALAYTLDARYGKHSFSIKNSDGDASNLMPESGFPYSGWTRTDDNERSETSLTYTYKINNNWSMAVGNYKGENDQDYVNSGNYPTSNPFDWATTHVGFQTNDSDGNYIAMVYQNKISNNLFWFGKLGYQRSTLKVAQTYKFNEVATVNSLSADAGIDQAWLDAYFSTQVNNGGGNLFVWDVNYEVETDGNAKVFGLGLVYVLENPKNTITLSYETKNFSYDAGKITNYTYAGQSFANSSDIGDLTNSSTTGTTFDESADYLSLTYRYQF